MSVLREIAAKFGLEFDGTDVEKMNAGIGEGVELLKGLGAALVGAEIVRGVREFVEDFTQAGAAVQQTADMLGIGTNELQFFQYAAGQAGIGTERFSAALQRLNVSIDTARMGTGPAADAFHALGVRITDAHGVARPMGDVLNDMADGFQRIQDPTRRTGIAVDIFGRAGARMVNVLGEGREGIDALRQQFQQLGGAMGEDAVEAAENYERATRRQDTAMMALKSVIANALLPIITTITDKITGAIATFQAWTRDTHVVQIAMMALSTIAIVELWPTIMRLVSGFIALARAQGLAFLGITAAILIVDDLWTLFRGGHSLIGALIDRFLGLGASQRTVAALKEVWEAVARALRNAWSDAGQVLDVFGRFISWNIGFIKRQWIDTWNAVDRFFGGALTRMTQRFQAWAAPIMETLRTIGVLERPSANAPIGGTFSASTTATGKTEQSLLGKVQRGRTTELSRLNTDENSAIDYFRAFQHDVMGDTDLSTLVHAVNRTGQEAAKPTHITQHNEIHVHGMSNPQEAARVIDRHLRDREHAAADAANPRPQRE